MDKPLAGGSRLLAPVPSDPIPSAGPECGEEQSPLAGDGHRNQRQAAAVGAGGRRAAGERGSAGIWAARGEKRGFAAAALRRWVAMEEGMGWGRKRIGLIGVGGGRGKVGDARRA